MVPADFAALEGNDSMADLGKPHFHNEPGAAVISVGAREFMCIGALPPLDHPHVFLDMGFDDEIVCSYCSTLFRYDPTLKAGEARPPECLWTADPAPALAP
jgi:uncharacterized Zn-finger protein